MDLNHVLECAKKTNHGMTMDKLIEELSKCRYSTVALVMVCKNDKNILQNEKSMIY